MTLTLDDLKGQIRVTKIKIAFWSEMARNANENEFRTSKMVAGGHFENRNESCVLIWNAEKCKRKWISDIENGHRQPFWEKNEILIWNIEKCKQKWLVATILKKWNGEKCKKKTVSFRSLGPFISWKFAIHKEMFTFSLDLAWKRSKFVFWFGFCKHDWFFWNVV